MEEVQEKRVIDISPLSKWKRILLFLGDYFITFILAFILFNLAVFPLGKVICQTEKKNKLAQDYESTATELLVSSGFMFRSYSGDDTFENHANYTFKVFLSYYVFDEENPDSNNPQYGHKIQNEVIRTYYVNYLNDEGKYLEYFNDANQANMLFDIGENANSITLKSDYKVLLRDELLEQTDEEKFTDLMKNVRDNVFARLFYIRMYQNILDNDYVKDNVSYNTCMAKVRSISKSLQWVPVGSAFISLTLAWSITYLLYPLINKNRRTPTMSAMRVDKIDFRRFTDMKRSTVIVQSIYSFILCSSQLLFLPILYFGIAYSFNLPMLFILLVISVAMMLTFMMFIFFNEFNRSGSDVLTYTVVIPTEELDNLYKAKFDEGRLPS